MVLSRVDGGKPAREVSTRSPLELRTGFEVVFRRLRGMAVGENQFNRVLTRRTRCHPGFGCASANQVLVLRLIVEVRFWGI